MLSRPGAWTSSVERQFASRHRCCPQPPHACFIRMSARSFIQQQEGAHEIPVTCGYMEQTSFVIQTAA